MAKLGIPYTRQKCQLMCQQKKIIDKLGCYDMRLPRIYSYVNVGPCNDLKSFNAIKNMTMTFKAKGCDDWCPFECESSDYTVRTSYLAFPSYQWFKDFMIDYPDMMPEDITFEQFSSSFVGLNVHFDDIKVTYLYETPAFTVFDLIANIGGVLALLIGFTLIVIVDLFGVIVEVSLTVIKSYMRQT